MGLEFFILLCLILLNGFFALSEMAIVSSRKARLRHEAERGRKNYRQALETAEDPSRFLSTIQVVITLIGTLVGAFGGATIARSLEAGLASVPLLAPVSNPVSIVLVAVGTALVSVVLGELVPKNIALARPEAISAAVIGPVRVFTFLFAPLARFLAATTDLVVRLLGAKLGAAPAVTEDEVRMLIAQGVETGVFKKSEREMVDGVLSLDDRRVTSLMTPRTEVRYVDLADGQEAARRTIVELSGYSYLPLVDGGLDAVIGMLPVKRCLAAMASGAFGGPRELCRRPVFIPESFSALRALAALKSGGAASGLILDEYGEVSGLIALSDLVGSVIGEAPGGQESAISRRQDGRYLVDGALPLVRFCSELRIEEERFGDYDTVAGLVLDRLGAIPRPGDSCRWKDLELEVLAMDGNRVDKLLVTRVDG